MTGEHGVMLNFLVMVEDSPASQTALHTVCLLDREILVHPVYTAPSKGHDLVMGAGWAWKTWERENRRRAVQDVEDLVSVQRGHCQNLKAPVVVSGRPVKAVTASFFAKSCDLVVAGTPFRGMPPLTLARRFQKRVRARSRDLPLLIVKTARPIRNITALTDGSDPAEKALGVLNRLVPRLDARVTLVGLAGEKDSLTAREVINLERGFAILQEKGIKAEGFSAKHLNRLTPNFPETDLLVLPFSSAACLTLFEGIEARISAVLFFFEGNEEA